MAEVGKQSPNSNSKIEETDDDTPTDLHRQQRGGPGSETPSLLYQLRRVGAAASLETVKDVFKLTKPRTTIGRNQSEVDCFVDSSIHTRLISRQHAEIHMELDENQSPALHVLDKSLNGTFVNDVKVSAHTKVPFKEGDTLTLGHLRGVQVKQGTYAEQKNSEFRFRLVYGPIEDESTEDDENTPTKRKNKESPKVVKKTRILHPPDSNVSSPTRRAASRPPPFLQQSSGAESDTGVVPISVHKENTHMKNETLSLRDNDSMDEEREEENTRPMMNSDLRTERPRRGRGRGSTRGQGTGRGRGNARMLGRGRGRGRGDTEKMETGIDDGLAMSARSDAPENIEFEAESASEEDSALHHKVEEICQKVLETSDSDSAKTRPGPSKAEQSRPGPSKPGPKRGRPPKDNVPSKSEAKTTEKKKGESASSAANGISGKRKASKKGSIEYNSQPCSSAKCCRPKNRTVSWVQCDDCDDWYHVTCAGCDYNKVKQPDYQFYCGCKRKANKK